MSTKFKIKRSSVAGKSPLASDIDVGELAINLLDGRLFTKNGSNVVVDVVGQNVNTSANVVFNTANLTTINLVGGFSANGSNGSSGQVLTTNGTAAYWSTVAGGGGGGGSFSNGQSIQVANLEVSNSLIANGSSGAAGQVLYSNGSSIYWANTTVTGGAPMDYGFVYEAINTYLTQDYGTIA